MKEKACNRKETFHSKLRATQSNILRPFNVNSKKHSRKQEAMKGRNTIFIYKIVRRTMSKY